MGVLWGCLFAEVVQQFLEVSSVVRGRALLYDDSAGADCGAATKLSIVIAVSNHIHYGVVAEVVLAEAVDAGELGVLIKFNRELVSGFASLFIRILFNVRDATFSVAVLSNVIKLAEFFNLLFLFGVRAIVMDVPYSSAFSSSGPV